MDRVISLSLDVEYGCEIFGLGEILRLFRLRFCVKNCEKSTLQERFFCILIGNILAEG